MTPEDQTIVIVAVILCATAVLLVALVSVGR